MIPLIESLVDAFETRRLSRRELVASLAALVATGVSASAQTPAVQPISKVAQGATINHISLAVTDVERSAQFYSRLLGLKEVSRPANGGINLGLGTSFLGLYKLANHGTVNHCCIGVDSYDPVRIAASLKEMGVQARIDTNRRTGRAAETSYISAILTTRTCSCRRTGTRGSSHLSIAKTGRGEKEKLSASIVTIRCPLF